MSTPSADLTPSLVRLVGAWPTTGGWCAVSRVIDGHRHMTLQMTGPIPVATDTGRVLAFGADPLDADHAARQAVLDGFAAVPGDERPDVSSMNELAARLRNVTPGDAPRPRHALNSPAQGRVAAAALRHGLTVR